MFESDTLEDLAAHLDIDVAGLVNTVKEYNAAVQTDVTYNPTIKDGRGTVGLAVNKTNWAETIDTPPYLGWAVTTGISFTFGGVKINTRGQVVNHRSGPHSRALRRRGDGRRAVLLQLPRRLGPVCRDGVWPSLRHQRRPGTPIC